MEIVVSTLMLIKGFYRRVNRIGLKNGCYTTCYDLKLNRFVFEIYLRKNSERIFFILC